ncbi:hypothetical protein [Streptomyces sp. NPDC057682]|uniref:hypothetical protein n=1 Tax=Streptomyces sp. NPDC057682 TaxID=3346210 RepID=UPI0036A573FA
MPQVRGFWSVTLYDEHHFFHPNGSEEQEPGGGVGAGCGKGVVGRTPPTARSSTAAGCATTRVTASRLGHPQSGMLPVAQGCRPCGGGQTFPQFTVPGGGSCSRSPPSQEPSHRPSRR